MELLLLGTGAADGWPDPWCTCASCAWMRAHDDIRGQTSALLDGVLVFDCGPEAPRAALRHGRSLAGVRHLLFSHGHPDHCGPAALMWRGWMDRPETLDVVAPPAVVNECRQWIEPDAPIRFTEVSAGDQITVGDYAVRVLPAEHGDASIGPAVLYDVTGPDGVRMFWGTDTRVVPPLRGRFDLVLLECANGDDLEATTDHLNLRTFPEALARLRADGCVDDATRVIAVHLGHRNPPPPELTRRLAAWGVEAPPDGTTVHLSESRERADCGQILTSRRGGGQPRRVLVLGGARSGKSVDAERRLAAEPDVTYVATSLDRPGDDDWRRRVAEHRARRPSRWATVETLDVVKLLREPPSAALLIDCLTLWTGGVMDEPDVQQRIDDLVHAWRTTSAHVVAVSNEVGSGVHPETEAGRRFRDLLGTLNARIAAESDAVFMVSAGLTRQLR